ncbi:hypothetical protein B0H16DRAFT_1561110 [Mycena metata]|uniref:Secreted protein n=1 Tax=Mycena metata TaxID=1033252 RepID=A0AAD7IKG8_9AGAR|nr:hypothetical protein B0H16DRAFT_1561110 [Mycena metata]
MPAISLVSGFVLTVFGIASTFPGPNQRTTRTSSFPSTWSKKNQFLSPRIRCLVPHHTTQSRRDSQSTQYAI